MAQLPRPPDPYRAAKAAGKAVSAIGSGIQEVAEVYRPEADHHKKRTVKQAVETAVTATGYKTVSNTGKVLAAVVGGGLLWWMLGKR